MSGTEGLGGPCPRCDEMNCFIKKGSGTWYTFLACPNCYFAYGEHADDMLEQTGGIVAGADVWDTLIYTREIESLDEINSWMDEDVEFTVETPFDMTDVEEWAMNLCVTSETTLERLIKQQ